MEQLKLHFSKSFEADVWDQNLSSGRLLLSLRDTERMEASFSLLDLKTGTFEFEGLTFEENWWVSVYHFFEETVVFQVFEDTQDIESKSYFALDLTSQEAIWSLDGVITLGRQGDFLQMKTPEEGVAPFWLDIRSGETIEFLPKEYLTEDIQNGERSPLHYTEEGPYFATIQTFLKDKLGVEALKACDYLEYKSNAFIGYHIQGKGGLEHFVLVLTERGEVLLHEKREEGLKGLISGAFFIAGEQLIFVSGRKTLNSYVIV